MLTKFFGAAALVSVAGLAVVFWLLLDAKQQNGELQQANAGLEMAVKATTDRMAEYALDVQGELDSWQTSYNSLLENFSYAREEAEQTKALFAQHDFRKLLDEKPGLVRVRANAATVRLFADIETASRGDSARETGDPDTAATAGSGSD